MLYSRRRPSHDRLVSIDLSLLPDKVHARIAAQAATIARQQVELGGQQARIAVAGTTGQAPPAAVRPLI